MIRVFPRRTKWTPTDDLAFVGPPPLFRPPEQPVKISVVFTWDIRLAEELKKMWGQFYPNVQIGGPAYSDPGGDFIPGRFIADGVTITSRGCVRKCPWCFVPHREGRLRELPIKDGWIIQDNNILACGKKHIGNVFNMLKRVNKPAIFKGGLDARLLRQWHVDLFDSIKIGELWFACDSRKDIATLEKISSMLDHISQNKKRCYTMIGFNGETLGEAERRLEAVYDLGFLPFSQLYQGETKKIYSKEWRQLNRKWSRPAAYKTAMALRNHK